MIYTGKPLVLNTTVRVWCNQHRKMDFRCNIHLTYSIGVREANRCTRATDTITQHTLRDVGTDRLSKEGMCRPHGTQCREAQC